MNNHVKPNGWILTSNGYFPAKVIKESGEKYLVLIIDETGESPVIMREEIHKECIACSLDDQEIVAQYEKMLSENMSKKGK